jgi:hypothetical protein
MADFHTLLLGVAGALFLLLTFVNIYFAVKHGRLYQLIKRERALVNQNLDELNQLEKKIAQQKLKVMGLDKHLPGLN